MRKVALIAATAAALPLLAATPTLAQNNTAQPQNKPQQFSNQNSMQKQQPANQHQSANTNMNGNQNAAENLSQGEIRQIQQALDQKGFSAGRADGKLGPETKRALSQFQQKQGLQQTGMPDEQTLAALGIGGGTTGQAPNEPQNGPAQNQNHNGQQKQPAPGK